MAVQQMVRTRSGCPGREAAMQGAESHLGKKTDKTPTSSTLSITLTLTTASPQFQPQSEITSASLRRY